MGISILVGYSEGHKDEPDYEHAIWFCNTSEWGFGPLFKSTENKSAEEIARGFLNWYDEKYGDPRPHDDSDIEDRHIDYLKHIGEVSR